VKRRTLAVWSGFSILPAARGQLPDPQEGDGMANGSSIEDRIHALERALAEAEQVGDTERATIILCRLVELHRQRIYQQ